MRICIVLMQPFPYFVGGIKEHVLNIFPKLANGNEIFVITSKYSLENTKFISGMKIERIGIPYKPLHSQRNILLSFLYFSLFYFVYSFCLILKIIKLCLFESFDIFHLQDTLSWPASICKLFKKKLIITYHGFFSAGFRELYLLEGKKFMVPFSYLLELFGLFLLLVSDKAIFVSRYHADYYRKYRSDILVIPNCVDITLFRPDRKKREKARVKLGISKKHIVIGFLGRLTEQKGIRKAVFSFNYLVKSCKNIKMVIAGDGPLKGWVLSFIKDNNLTNKCLYLGYVDDPTEVYNLSDVMVMLSEFEGQPISLLEAMACGKPVISSDIREIKDVLKDCGIYVAKKDSIKNIVFKLKKFLKNKKRLRILGKKALVYVKKYSLTKVIGSYKKMYQDLLVE